MTERTGTRFVALLDASVLFSIRVTNLALQVATQGLFQPKWSDAIHDEWARSVVAKDQSQDPARINRRRTIMDQSFPDAKITGFEPLIDGLTLPDPGDRHVLAAAIAAEVDVVVTFNIRHFPADALTPHGIEAQHPDAFLLQQLTLAPVAFIEAARSVRDRLNRPPQSPDDFLDALRRAGLPHVTLELSQHKDKF